MVPIYQFSRMSMISSANPTTAFRNVGYMNVLVRSDLVPVTSDSTSLATPFFLHGDFKLQQID